MRINSAFDLGQTVYRIHKEQRDPGTVIEIVIKLGGTILYYVSFPSGSHNWFYAEELSNTYEPSFTSEESENGS